MILIFGGSGFIGSYIVKELNKNNKQYTLSKTRIQNYEDVKSDIEKYKPTHIISAAGLKTPTTVDYYETHKSDLLLVNTVGNIILANLSQQYNIHLTLIMSGCIYKYPDCNYHKSYNEDDEPNFIDSYYSNNRACTENLLNIYNNICILRLRMPISYSLHPKSLITKLINYRNIVNIPNSMTVLEDMIPFINIVIEKKLIGKFNLVNSGVMTHPSILYLYKKYVNISYNYKIIEENEQNILAKRSNCSLKSDKVGKYMEVKNIGDSIFTIMKSYKKILDQYHLF